MAPLVIRSVDGQWGVGVLKGGNSRRVADVLLWVDIYLMYMIRVTWWLTESVAEEVLYERGDVGAAGLYL